MANTKLGFKKGNAFTTYVEGEVYFETSTHLLKVGLAGNSCEVYSGVRSAAWDASNKKLTIVNEGGSNIELDFSDVASAEGVTSLLAGLRTDINSKLAAPATAGSQGQVLRLGANGATEWYTIPAATDYSITVDSSQAGTTSGYLKSYHIAQNGVEIAVIDIPKDLVVTSGQIVEVSGVKYLRLTIANQDTPVDIAVSDLVDAYTAAQNAAQVQLAISNTNEISATIVAGSIGTTELDASVNASLGKADSALQAADIAEGATNGTISVKGTDISVHGLGTAAYLNASSLVQSVAEGTAAGSIKVDGTDVSVHGLGTAAYEASTAFATAAQGALADTAIQSVAGETAVTDSSFVAISVEASTNGTAVTLSSHANVTTQDVSTATANANGLATALSVKNYVDSQHEWLQFN